MERRRDVARPDGTLLGVQSENGLVRAFRVFEFNQIRRTYVIRPLLSLLTNINIQALKKCYAPNTSLWPGLHLSMRFVRLQWNPTRRMLFKNDARRRLSPLRAARLAMQWQERRGNERKSSRMANIHKISRISSCYMLSLF